jgi:hypothetical protein
VSESRLGAVRSLGVDAPADVTGGYRAPGIGSLRRFRREMTTFGD